MERLMSQKLCSVLSVDNLSVRRRVLIVALSWMLTQTSAKYAIIIYEKTFALSVEPICLALKPIAQSAVAPKAVWCVPLATRLTISHFARSVARH